MIPSYPNQNGSHLKTMNSGQDVDKRKPLYTDSGDAN